MGLGLNECERAQLIKSLIEYIDIFAWSNLRMPYIDREIAQHTIPLTEGMKSVEQKLQKMKPGAYLIIKEEVIKQLNAGLIKVANCHDWMANVVPVPKNDARVRIGVDYRDLNKKNPKDGFLLLHIDILIYRQYC